VILGDMRKASKASLIEASLSCSDLHEMFLYDKETGALFWRRPNPGCNNVRPGDKAGSVASTGHLDVYIRNVRCSVHRVVFCMNTGEWPKQQIDHINGIRDDNRMCNLRDCDQTLNQRNRFMSRNNTSGATGVHFLKCKNRWRATIYLGNKQKFIGTFVEFDDAVNARKAAEMKFGFSSRHGSPSGNAA
jgi:hypothetical protein